MKIENGILTELDCNTTNLVFPRGMSSISQSAYDEFGLNEEVETIEVEEGNEYYHSKNNCLIETATKTLVMGCKNSIIPDDGSVTKIGKFAFNGCVEAKTIEIPEGITEIEGMAFAFTDYENITIPESVKILGELCFAVNPQLKSVTIKGKDTEFGDVVFGTTIEYIEVYKDEFPQGNDNIKIYAPTNSTAIDYAKKFGIKYEEMLLDI